MAAQLARLLNLPGHPPEAAVAARDKRVAREKFRAGGLLVPNSFAVPMGVDPLTVLPRVDSRRSSSRRCSRAAAA